MILVVLEEMPALWDEVVVELAEGAQVARMAQSQLGEHVDGVLRRIKTFRQRKISREQIIAVLPQMGPQTAPRRPTQHTLTGLLILAYFLFLWRVGDDLHDIRIVYGLSHCTLCLKRGKT